jgi:hypothetical protein
VGGSDSTEYERPALFASGLSARILEGGDIRQSAGVSLFRDSRNTIYEAGAGSYTFSIEE